MAYLQILVNSRSELGLARALNVPDRELDHRAFSALKKEAKAKGLSMFQVSVLNFMTHLFYQHERPILSDFTARISR